MLKRNYYCLVAGLPDLLFNENKLALSSLSFRNELRKILSNTDLKILEQILFTFDNQNLINILFERDLPFNELGNFSRSFLEDQITAPTIIPDFMVSYIKWTKDRELKEFPLQNENKLYQLFYEHILTLKSDFLTTWFKFDLNLRNILTAFNCKQFKYDTEGHIISTFQDNIANELISGRSLRYESFEEIPYAEEIFRIADTTSGFLDKETATDKIKWNYLEEITFFHYFTIEKILAFFLKLIIVERLTILDKETGREFLDKLVHELKESYEHTMETIE